MPSPFEPQMIDTAVALGQKGNLKVASNPAFITVNQLVEYLLQNVPAHGGFHKVAVTVYKDKAIKKSVLYARVKANLGIEHPKVEWSLTSNNLSGVWVKTRKHKKFLSSPDLVSLYIADKLGTDDTTVIRSNWTSVHHFIRNGYAVALVPGQRRSDGNRRSRNSRGAGRYQQLEERLSGLDDLVKSNKRKCMAAVTLTIERTNKALECVHVDTDNLEVRLARLERQMLVLAGRD